MDYINENILNTKKVQEENSGVIEKLVLTLDDKKYAEMLKDDMVLAGVPKTDIKVRSIKNSKNCKLTIFSADVNIQKVIRMFMGEGYELSTSEIEKLLNIKIVF